MKSRLKESMFEVAWRNFKTNSTVNTYQIIHIMHFTFQHICESENQSYTSSHATRLPKM